AARRVLLFARDHVARTHDAALRVAAVADADAPGRRMRERAAVARICEVRLDVGGPVVDAELEIRRDRVRLDDLAGVHLPVRVPNRLELAKRADDLVAEHPRQELRAGLAVAVLAR